MARLAGLAALLVAIFASQARANAGYPMIVAVWPATWALLLPVIAVESVVAARALRVGAGSAFRVSIVANGVSAIAGIPLTWLILALTASSVAGDWMGDWLSVATLRGRLVAVTLGSPWLGPVDESRLRWMVVAAGMSLCVPFFLMSVVVEGFMGRLFLEGESRKRTWRWAWIANAVSYGLVLIGLGVLLWKRLA
jgi:hypothetical protein